MIGSRRDDAPTEALTTAGTWWSSCAWLVAYALLSVAFTFPLVTRLGAVVPGWAGDAHTYIWAADTFWTELVSGRSPLWTQRVLYPVGANLMHVTIAPFVSTMAYPFWPSHLVLFFGIMPMVALVAAGFSMRALVLALTGDRIAAGVAGALYVASPPLVSLIAVTHYYTVVAAALVPLVLLGVYYAVTSAPRYGLLLGSAAGWALFFTDYYITVLVAVMLIVVAFFQVPTVLRRWRSFAWALAGNGVALIAVFAVLPSFDINDLAIAGDGLWSRAIINLADLFIPREENLLFGGLSKLAYDRPNGDLDYYLGWGVLALAVVGVIRYRRNAFVIGLVAAALVAIALSCGTRLRVGALEIDGGAWMPWRWLVAVPSLSLLDCPRRFVLGAQVIVVFLAGLGLAHWRRPALALLVGLLLGCLDYGQFGMRTTEMPVPQAYQWLATRRGDGVLLELPGGVTESKNIFGGLLGLDFGGQVQNNEQNYWQTVHRKRRVAAYLSRIPLSTYHWFADEPVMGDLLVLTSTKGTWRDRTLHELPSYTPDEIARFQCMFDLGYVLLAPNPRQAVFARGVEQLFDGKIIRKDKDGQGFVLYELERCAPATSSLSARHGAAGVPAEGIQKTQ